MHRINWINAIAAGVAGTILFDIVGLITGEGWWELVWPD